MGVVIATALIVGVYIIRNPNGIRFEAWPLMSETAAAAAAVLLGLSVRRQRQRRDRGFFALSAGMAALALLLLGAVAFVLSFNQI